MANSIADLLVRMDIDSAKLKAGLKSIDSEFKKFQNSAAMVRNALASAFAVVGGAAAARELATFVKAGAEAAEQMGKLAQMAGQPVEQMSRLAEAARMSDVDADALGKTLLKLSDALAKASTGSKEQAAIFRAMGFSNADVTAMLGDTHGALLKVADKVSGYADGAEKAALVSALFGDRLSKELIPFLNKGASGIAELEASADRLGRTMSAEVVEGANRFNDAMKDLEGIQTALASRISAELAPALESITGKFNEASGGARSLDVIARGVAESLKGLAAFAVVTGAVIETSLGGPVKRAIEELGGLAEAVAGLKNGSPAQIALGVNRALTAPLAGDPIAEANRALEKLKAIYSEAGKMSSAGAAVWAPPSFATKPRAPLIPDSKAADAAARSLDTLRDAVAEYQKKIASVGRGDFAQLDWELKFGKFAEAAKKAGPEGQKLIPVLRALGEEWAVAEAKEKSAAQLAEWHKKVAEEAAKVVEDSLDPWDKYNQRLDDLANYLEAGLIKWPEFNAAVAKAREELDKSIITWEDAGKKVDEMSVFAHRAAENIQDILAENLFDGFKHGLDGMVAAFGQALLRMAAQAASARILDKIGLGEGGGIWKILGLNSGNDDWAGSGDWQDIDATIAGTRAGGGPVSAASTYLVGEKGPELFTPNISGQIVPNEQLGGGSSISVALHVSAMDGRSVEQWWDGGGGEVVLKKLYRAKYLGRI